MTTLIRKNESPNLRQPRTLQALGWQVGIRSYAWSPPTDVYETDECIVVRVEVAGMKEEEFSIQFEKDLLVISGIRTESGERRAYQQMEIRFGEFSAAVQIHAVVDIEHADASYENGFLTVILPKSNPKNIPILS